MHWDRRANVRGVSGVSGVLGSLPSPGTWQWCDSCARGFENQRHRVSAGGGMRGCSSMDSARRRMTNQWNVTVRWPAAACGGGAACMQDASELSVERCPKVVRCFSGVPMCEGPPPFRPQRNLSPFAQASPFAQVQCPLSHNCRPRASYKHSGTASALERFRDSSTTSGSRSSRMCPNTVAPSQGHQC